MSWSALAFILCLGASAAFLLGLAVTITYLALPRPRQHGFDVVRGDD